MRAYGSGRGSWTLITDRSPRTPLNPTDARLTADNADRGGPPTFITHRSRRTLRNEGGGPPPTFMSFAPFPNRSGLAGPDNNNGVGGGALPPLPHVRGEHHVMKVGGPPPPSLSAVKHDSVNRTKLRTSVHNYTSPVVHFSAP